MDVKTYLYAWFSRQNVMPVVEVRATGVKPRRKFLCEIRVKGCLYTGYGNSVDSDEAETNAANDFLHYFLRQKMITPEEVPKEILESIGFPITGLDEDVTLEKVITSRVTSACRMKRAGTVTAAGVCGSSAESQNETSSGDILSDTRNLTQPEEVDNDATVHGNWTIENAQPKLRQFLQQNNMKSDYRYSLLDTDGCRNFVAELTIYLQELNVTLTGRESSPNKLTASKKCALSLVRQLYHLGVIDAFTGSFQENVAVETKLEPCEVVISPELENKILDVLNDLNIEPVTVDTDVENEEPVSIMNDTVIDDFDSSNPQPPQVIAWSPPQANWNPWLSCRINEGPLAATSLEDMSKHLENEMKERLQQEGILRKLTYQRYTLPIAKQRTNIMNMINDNAVCLIRGNPGCGKSTQVGQYILDDYVQTGQGAHCNIIITQPRRIATISNADRVAFERGEILGMSVGYSVPFETTYPRPYGSILFCTVDALIKKLENGLKGISHVIVDEVHERDVNTDFILIILRDMVNAYPDLRLIIMSATMDTTLISNYFTGCPIVDIPGQLFPVKEFFLEDALELLKFFPAEQKGVEGSVGINLNEEEDEDSVAEADGEENLNLKIDRRYSPDVKYALSLMDEKEINFDLIHDILIYIKNLGVKGAVLIFLPAWSVVFSLMRHLHQCIDFASHDYVILPLHSYLSADDQRRVFENFPPDVTKVILSTNIAESSITINDVACVIDSCKTEIITSHNNSSQRAMVWASKTHLEQRKGRAGRVGPGYCFHLCSKARYEALEENETPEIFRSPLHELALAVKMLGLGEIRPFLSKAIQPPPEDAVTEAEVFLREMKYLDKNDELTSLGRIIGQLPIDPRLGRMLILGMIFNCGNALSTIAANSAKFPGVFYKIMDRKELTFQQKSFSGIRYSDHVAIINAFQTWERAVQAGTDVELCGSKMLSEASLNLTADIKYQLISLLVNRCGFPQEALMDQTFSYHGPDPNLDMVVALLSVGLYPNIAYHVSRRKLVTMDNKFALINQRSVNFNSQDEIFPFPFFVYGEKVKAKTVACKQTTLVTPASLLLFGARKVEYVNGLIRLDGWINLKMKPSVASSIVALRPAIESLIIRAAKKPSEILALSYTNEKVLNVIRELCESRTGNYGAEVFDIPTFEVQSHRQVIYRPLEEGRIQVERQNGAVSGLGGHQPGCRRREFDASGSGYSGGIFELRIERRVDYGRHNLGEAAESRDQRSSRVTRVMVEPRERREPIVLRDLRDLRELIQYRDLRNFRNTRNNQANTRNQRTARHARSSRSRRSQRNLRNLRNVRNLRSLRSIRNSRGQRVLVNAARNTHRSWY